MPKRQAGKLYPHQISVRCTASERRRIHENARLSGRSASRYLVAVGAAPSGGSPRILGALGEATPLQAVHFELRKISFLLSQLAHREQLATLDPLASPPAAAELIVAGRATNAALRRLQELLR